MKGWLVAAGIATLVAGAAEANIKFSFNGTQQSYSIAGAPLIDGYTAVALPYEINLNYKATGFASSLSEVNGDRGFWSFHLQAPTEITGTVASKTAGTTSQGTTFIYTRIGEIVPFNISLSSQIRDAIGISGSPFQDPMSLNTFTVSVNASIAPEVIETSVTDLSFDFVDGSIVFGDYIYYQNDPAPIPESSIWLMMVCGFGLMGGLMRCRQRVTVRFA